MFSLLLSSEEPTAYSKKQLVFDKAPKPLVQKLKDQAVRSAAAIPVLGVAAEYHPSFTDQARLLPSPPPKRLYWDVVIPSGTDGIFIRYWTVGRLEIPVPRYDVCHTGLAPVSPIQWISVEASS
jgi:hypothetical protein